MKKEYQVKNELILLAGLPGCGKSTYCQEHFAGEDYLILSSDVIRKELLGNEGDQTQNGNVFQELYKRAKASLLNGKTVVIDATNINRKDRKRALSNFTWFKGKKTCILLVATPETCVYRDTHRERHVGADVIIKYTHRFEIPIREEGFDEVRIEYSGEFNDGLHKVSVLLDKMENYDQHCKYHAESLSEHCYEGYNFVRKEYGKDDLLAFAALFHDVGKIFTQTFDNEGEAHYFGHANVGAYLLLCCYPNDMIYWTISDWDFNYYQMVWLVNYHMFPFSIPKINDATITDKMEEKYCKLFGKENFLSLLELHEIDKICAHQKI